MGDSVTTRGFPGFEATPWGDKGDAGDAVCHPNESRKPERFCGLSPQHPTEPPSYAGDDAVGDDSEGDEWTE